MGSSFWFDTFTLDGTLYIYMYLGVSGYIFKNIEFMVGRYFFTLANIVDPGEMPHYAAFHLGLHCLQST